MESFLFQILYQKNTHVGFETSINFIFLINIPNEWSRKKIQGNNIWGSFYSKHKTHFFIFFNDFNF
jgi:hypothetical protein